MTATLNDTYRGATFISTDSHVTEPIELYAERVDAEFRDRAPRIETQGRLAHAVRRGPRPPQADDGRQLQGAVVGDFDIESPYPRPEHATA